MIRIFDIALKDLLQLSRDRNTFLFLLIMPISFTLLFGYAFGGYGEPSDPRLPVGYRDEDDSRVSKQLFALLNDSEIIRLEEFNLLQETDLEAMVVDENLAAAIVVPAGYGRAILNGKPAKLIVIAESGTSTGTSIESEALANIIHLEIAVRIASIMEQMAPEQAPFNYILEEALSRWEEPPISISETTSSVIHQQDNRTMSLAHTAPGFMLQFAIAGLLTTAQILVTERKTRSLQRMLTTATARVHILLGHYLAIFLLIFCQFLLLILFGQYILRVNYLNDPAGTLLVAFSAATCIAALGLLIGVFAKSEEQAVVFSIVPMFVLAGLGGAWVPLEVTGETFQIIGHASPIAWAMDGFKNISVRGLGLDSTFLPSLALFGYTALFFILSVWRFQTLQES
jgi:ABC-2 type transport system permease protein